MIVAGQRHRRQFETRLPSGPDNYNVRRPSVRVSAEEIGLAGIVGKRLPSEGLGVGQQSAHRRQREVAWPWRQVGVQQAELDLALAIVWQHEIEDRRGPLLQPEDICLGDPLALQPQVLFAGFLEPFIPVPFHRDAAFGYPERFAGRQRPVIRVKLRIILQRLVVVKVEGVKVRPRLIRAKIGQRRFAVDGKDVEAGNHIRVAGFQAQVSRLLQRGHLTAGMPAKILDVGLIPRLERLDLPLPAVGQFLVESIDVPQVEWEALCIRVRPGS